MRDLIPGRATGPDADRLLAYAADLELEVDRLRRHGTFLERETNAAILRILPLCTGPEAAGVPALAEVRETVRSLLEVVKDLHDLPGYHPAHDQVVAIAVRPLTEQVFRWQQRLTGSGGVALRLDLQGSDHVVWFPARLRHILDNLLGHALRHRDATADPWVSVSLRTGEGGYELVLSDTGISVAPGDDRRGLDLFYRAPVDRDRLGIGLAVVRMLVEQSGGTLAIRPREGRGTDLVLTLPRYDLLDYLE